MNDTDTTGLFQVRFTIPSAAVDEVLAAVEELGESLSAYEEGTGEWVCEILVRGAPDLDALVCELDAALGGDAPDRDDFAVTPLAERDWLEATKRSFPPLTIGRFWVHGSHVEETPPPGTVPLLIDAGRAFGSGEHGSTTGCLWAIHDLARTHRFARVLDVGCGSAILAIAALTSWPTARGLATDIDPGSVAAAAANARVNGVAARLRTVVADGYDRPDLQRADRFDLVLANILAGPLMAMAPDLAHTLAPGGQAVLAGLLNVQAPAVLFAHRRQGLRAIGRYEIGPWTTLVLAKPRSDRTRRRRIRHPSPVAVERWPVGPS